RSRKPHNAAREVFVRELLKALADRYARALGTTSADRDELLAELRESRDVRVNVNLLWLPVTPQWLLARLYAEPDRLAAAAGDRLSPAQRALLRGELHDRWTVADVALLDELAELLGEDETAKRYEEARAGRQRREELAYAREVLRSSGGGGLVSEEMLADRFADSGPVLTVAERAAGDREWAFGHVVVDEAQELSAMQWRVLLRRCPSRSMTLVGDVAQTSSVAGTTDWARTLEPLVPGRWRVEELTVNYRTPAAIMDVAGAVLAAAGSSVRAPRSVRDVDTPPTAHPCSPRAVVDVVAAVVRRDRDELGGGRTAVLSPYDELAELLRGLRAELGAATVGSGPEAVDAPVAVLTVPEAKGLEFDSVVLVEPAAVLERGPQGVHDLYVALTRPTQRLRVVYTKHLPTGLELLWTDASAVPASP
ncbi:MAG: ATP-binding domain-containing protein, partial [Actinomycetota bacterium]|nr:ATP-binding domain-containing protein [Actinomycetota bacterium]